MSMLINDVDARTQLAGTNRLELLLFHLGSSEVFGINVFKVREVMNLPSVTRVPEADGRLVGMANIRGTTVPVIDFRAAIGLHDKSPGGEERGGRGGKLIVTEYNQSLQGFLVSGVDRIVRLSWERITPPPRVVLENSRGLITAVTTLDDGRLILIADVETILRELCPQMDDERVAVVGTSSRAKGKCVLFADDSSTARAQIRKTLEQLGMSFVQTTTGKEAWDTLLAIADECAAGGQPVQDRIQLVLSDIEMPDMDGFTLTKLIRSEPRLSHLPVILHSSLTGTYNVDKGRMVGATDYVTKFDPRLLGEVLARHC